jgi:hypothetical protein
LFAAKPDALNERFTIYLNAEGKPGYSSGSATPSHLAASARRNSTRRILPEMVFGSSEKAIRWTRL